MGAHDDLKAELLADPEAKAAYEPELAHIRAVDRIVNALDAARVDLGVSKAEVARKLSMDPSALRRLLTSDDANPTLRTVAAIADAVGLQIKLVPKEASFKAYGDSLCQLATLQG